MTKGWEIKRLDRSQRNGQFYAYGINHESQDPLFKEFGWHLQSIFHDDRYFFAADIEILPGAAPLLVSPCPWVIDLYPLDEDTQPMTRPEFD